MQQPERQHDAAPVELAAGWIAICATCGWVGETYGNKEKATADSSRHIADPPREGNADFAFLGEPKRAAR